MDEAGAFKDELVSVRQGGDFRLVKPEEVTAIDVSPKQLVSVAAALELLFGESGGDADVLDDLVTRWSAPSRSALVNEALVLELGRS